MEQIQDENRAVMTGKVISGLEFSHKTYGESFFVMMVGITRKSGYEDQVPVMISERLMSEKNVQPGTMVTVDGQVRTYNRDVNGHNHLMIVVFARRLQEAEAGDEMENYIVLEGYTCKDTIRRTSPLGRELCDIMLAVNRRYNKSDYIPCIAWGRNAVYGGMLDVGTKLSVEGRFQSRSYRKYDEDGNYSEKTAYEISVVHMEECD